MTDHDLVGSWRLESYTTTGAGEGPLGPEPRGLLIYGSDGHMAVSMMAAQRDGDQSGDGRVSAFMGYAGTWRRDGDRVLHRVLVASHAYLVGTEQVRDVSVDGERLVLSGSTPPGAGPPQHRALVWLRVAGRPA